MLVRVLSKCSDAAVLVQACDVLGGGSEGVRIKAQEAGVVASLHGVVAASLHGVVAAHGEDTAVGRFARGALGCLD